MNEDDVVIRKVKVSHVVRTAFETYFCTAPSQKPGEFFGTARSTYDLGGHTLLGKIQVNGPHDIIELEQEISVRYTRRQRRDKKP